ncbi:hypothetical protein ABBQ32_009038 [Trebouxia sp. C0010 RCD-2024]
MHSLQWHHHACVTARPLPRSGLRVCAQQSPHPPDVEIAGGLHSRRTAVLSVVASLLAAPACAVISTSPYEDAKTMQYGLDSERRIRTCPGAVNPNCVSTRSLSQMYSPAWRATEPDPRTATKLFENALKRVCPEAQVVKQLQMPDADFRSFSVAGLYGQDIIEVLVRNTAEDGPTVTFRSMAVNVKYIWPLQAPLADGGAQRKRLNAVRQQLGWQIIGCDYIECFQ